MATNFKDHKTTFHAENVVMFCWDKRSKKPTHIGWAIFILLSIVCIHWVFFNPNQTSGSLDSSDVQPLNPKFGPNLQNGKDGYLVDPQEDEFQQVMKENNEEGNAPKLPIYNPNKHKEDQQRRLNKKNPYGIPIPKEFPVEILLEPILECGSNGYLVVVIVEDATYNTGARLAIRATWGLQDKEKYPKMEPNTWKTIFVMGRTDTHFDEIAKKENEMYYDILQGDFRDTPHEGTRKLMLAIQWLGENAGDCTPKFILKTQDDIFVNMFSITEWLGKRWGPSDKDLYVGHLLRQDIPIRIESDPMYVSLSDYPGEFFPDMLRAPVYLFDWSAFSKLHWYLQKVTPIALEDAFLGILAHRAGLKPRHNDHFYMINKPSNVCAHLKMFFIHNVLPNKHLQIYKANKKARVDGTCPNVKVVHPHEAKNGENFDL